jgi:tyrosine-protein kinase Etk/Wzc
MNTPDHGLYPAGNGGSNGNGSNGGGANHGGNPSNGGGPHNGGNGYNNGNGNGNVPVGYGSDLIQPPGGTPVRPQQPAPADLARIQRMSMDGDEKSNVNILDYVWLLWRGKWIILTCLVIAGLGTAYYTFSLPFVYQSSLTITINEQDDAVVPLFGGQYKNPARTLQRELQVMTSRPILEKTAQELIRIRHLDTAGALKDSVLPVIVAAEKALQPAWKAWTPEERSTRLMNQVASSIQRLITASPAKDADIIAIVTTAGDPNEARVIANTYAQVYQEDNKQQNRQRTRAMMQYLATRLGSVQDSLQKVEETMRSFQKSNKVLDGVTSGGMLASSKMKFDESIQSGRIQLATMQKQLEEYKKEIRDVEPTFSKELAAATPLFITQMQNQIAGLKVKRQMMSTENPAHASDAWYQRIKKDLNDQIQDLQTKLDSAVDVYKDSKLGSLAGTGMDPTSLNGLKKGILDKQMEIEALKANLAATEQGKAQVEGDISKIPDLALEMGRLSRDRESFAKIYAQVSDEYNKKAIEEQSLFSNAKIIEPAQANFKPISPNRSGNITVGSIVGLALGIGVVLLIAYTDTTVHSPDELEKNGFVVLSAIPLITENALTVANRAGIDLAENLRAKPSPHLITQIDPKSPIAESYRSLRTAVQYAAIESQVRTLLVTSSIPQEGKSTTSTNLAIVIAQSGSRTLLIDCDLRRPVLHSVFGMTKDPGLVNCLVGANSIDESIRESGIPNLYILPSGAIPPNPSELLGSRRMRMLLEELKERFDTIILDSPPVGTVTDSVILSTLVDASLVIVRAHKTKMEFLEKTRESIERISPNMLGVVLNDFDVSQSYGSTYRYYRYYKYYGYYGQGDEGGTEKKGKNTKKPVEKVST